jgi:hypothetical protein
VELFNFLLPTIYHSITISKRDGTSRVEKAYKFSDAGVDGKGEEWWTTWRYQLESFVDRVKGRSPQTWVEAKDSVANMESIEKIFAKVCVITAINLRCRSRLQTIDWAWTSSEIFLSDVHVLRNILCSIYVFIQNVLFVDYAQQCRRSAHLTHCVDPEH